MAGAKQIEKDIKARYEEGVVLFNQKKYEAVGTFYTENAVIMPPDGSPIVGRKAIVEACADLAAPFARLEYEGTDYFELVNDDTAYTSYFQAGKDDSDKKIILYMACLLWKRVGGQWYLDREFYNNRPSPSASPQDLAKNQIQSRICALNSAFNKSDYDAVYDFYAEDAIAVPNNANSAKGKKAIKELFQAIVPVMIKLVHENIEHFELLNDVTAYTNSRITSVDESGKVKAAFRDCLLWTKRDGKWLIRRDTFHNVPLPKT